MSAYVTDAQKFLEDFTLRCRFGDLPEESEDTAAGGPELEDGHAAWTGHVLPVVPRTPDLFFIGVSFIGV